MKDWIDTYWEKEALPKLIEYGTIPNVSPSFAPNWSEEGHMDRAAELLTAWAKSRDITGSTVELIRPKDRTPLIFIEIAGQREDTVLIYGHLDKQPPMLPWRDGLDPWNPVREGDVLYGRGLADDGYAIFAALGAVEAAQKSGAKLPRVCVMIEACEESGSPDLEYYVDTLANRINNPSVVITLDCEDRGADRLWLTQSLRGLVNGFLKVETIPSTMHSGLASGVVPSAGRILRMLLARIEDQNTGEILSDVVSPKLNEETQSYVAGVAKNVPDYLAAYDMPKNLMPAAATLQEVVANNLVKAALEVTGVSGQPSAETSGNVLVGSLTARLSIRIPPGVDPERAFRDLQQTLEANPPYGARVSFTRQSCDWGWMAKPFSPEMTKKINAITQSLFGTEPGYLGVGASIPFIKIMCDAFPQAEHIVTGILSHDSHAHGPNENMSISKAKRLTEFVAAFLRAP